MRRRGIAGGTRIACALLLAAACLRGGEARAAAPERIPLSMLVPIEAAQAWGQLGIDASVQGKRLRIGTRCAFIWPEDHTECSPVSDALDSMRPPRCDQRAAR